MENIYKLIEKEWRHVFSGLIFFKSFRRMVVLNEETKAGYNTLIF